MCLRQKLTVKRHSGGKVGHFALEMHTLDYLISDSQVIRDSLVHFGEKINRLTGNKRLRSQIGK